MAKVVFLREILPAVGLGKAYSEPATGVVGLGIGRQHQNQGFRVLKIFENF